MPLPALLPPGGALCRVSSFAEFCIIFNTGGAVSAIYRRHWGGRQAGAEPRRSTAPDRGPLYGCLKPHRLFLPTERRRARLVERLTVLEETGVTLITAAWSAATLGPATQLFITDHGQNWPQPLVIGDGALIDLANLIKGSVGELDAAVADCQPTVGIIDDDHPLADRRLGLVGRF